MFLYHIYSVQWVTVLIPQPCNVPDLLQQLWYNRAWTTYYILLSTVHVILKCFVHSAVTLSMPNILEILALNGKFMLRHSNIMM